MCVKLQNKCLGWPEISAQIRSKHSCMRARVCMSESIYVWIAAVLLSANIQDIWMLCYVLQLCTSHSVQHEIYYIGSAAAAAATKCGRIKRCCAYVHIVPLFVVV